MRERTPKIYGKSFHARSEGQDLIEIAGILGALRPEDDHLARHTWKTDKPWTKPKPKGW